CEGFAVWEAATPPRVCPPGRRTFAVLSHPVCSPRTGDEGTRVEVNSGAPLREIWYYAVAGERLRKGRTVAKVMLGGPLVLGRRQDGSVFALRDLCPHRGIPLSCGSFDGSEVTCRFHAWRFDGDGRCTAIPSLAPDQDFDVGRIKVKAYP